MSIHRFDVVVIGAGPAGENAAGLLSDGGLDVAIVEQHLIAGECSYYACMPSKALLRPQAVLDEALRIPGVAEAISGRLDSSAVLARRDEVIGNLDDSSHLGFLDEKGIELFRGHGLIVGEREVRVGESVLVAERAVIVATGSAASIPPIEGLTELDIWNNRQGTTSDRVPESLIVLGGGPVGCELAQAWASLGSRVCLVESAARLLSREEPFAGEQVETSLIDRCGVDVMTGSMVVAASGTVRSDPDGELTIRLEDGREFTASRLLVATGRMPRTDLIGLESVGLESGGYLETDDRMRTGGTDWLYAIGDVNGRSLLTHAGKYQAWIACQAILDRDVPTPIDSRCMPRVTFTDPQVAATGLTLDEAREAGVDALALDVPTDGTPGASFEGKDTGGTSRLVIDPESGRVLGATFTGYGTAEWIQAATIAIVSGITMDRLRHAVPAFPTRSEIWLKLQNEWDEATSHGAPRPAGTNLRCPPNRVWPMRILAFSDLHRDLEQAARLTEMAADADVVIGAGDFASIHNGLEETLGALTGIETPTILVAGNNETIDDLRRAAGNWPAATVLHGESTEIGGRTFFGLGGGIPTTPWSWSFDLDEDEAETALADLSADSVLVVHSPPKGHCDEAGDGLHLGSKAILAAIERAKPPLAVCGHIHESWGRTSQVGPTEVVNLGPSGRFFDLY